jgi:hypothetical protein
MISNIRRSPHSLSRTRNLRALEHIGQNSRNIISPTRPIQLRPQSTADSSQSRTATSPGKTVHSPPRKEGPAGQHPEHLRGTNHNTIPIFRSPVPLHIPHDPIPRTAAKQSAAKLHHAIEQHKLRKVDWPFGISRYVPHEAQASITRWPVAGLVDNFLTRRIKIRCVSNVSSDQILMDSSQSGSGNLSQSLGTSRSEGLTSHVALQTELAIPLGLRYSGLRAGFGWAGNLSTTKCFHDLRPILFLTRCRPSLRVSG